MKIKFVPQLRDLEEKNSNRIFIKGVTLCYFKLSSYKILLNDLFESDYNVTKNEKIPTVNIMRPSIYKRVINKPNAY